MQCASKVGLHNIKDGGSWHPFSAPMNQLNKVYYILISVSSFLLTTVVSDFLHQVTLLKRKGTI